MIIIYLKVIFPQNLNKISNTKVICFENTHIYNGGKLLDFNNFKKTFLPIKEKHNLHYHLDGSRILNAVIASKIPLKTLTKNFNSVNFCLSKGLGVPFGSVVFLENKKFNKAEKIQNSLGGVLNKYQSEILCTSALISLENFQEKIEEDHKKTKILYEGIKEIEGFLVKEPETNVLQIFLDGNFFKDFPNRRRFLIGKFVDVLRKDYKILVMGMEGNKYLRCVLHFQVSYDQVFYCIKAFRKAFEVVLLEENH